jgi:hypothetical protein
MGLVGNWAAAVFEFAVVAIKREMREVSFDNTSKL